MRMREERLRGSRKQLNMELSKKYSGGKKHGEKEKTRRDNQWFRRSIRIFGKDVITGDKILFVIRGRKKRLCRMESKASGARRITL